MTRMHPSVVLKIFSLFTTPFTSLMRGCWCFQQYFCHAPFITYSDLTNFKSINLETNAPSQELLNPSLSLTTSWSHLLAFSIWAFLLLVSLECLIDSELGPTRGTYPRNCTSDLAFSIYTNCAYQEVILKINVLGQKYCIASSPHRYWLLAPQIGYLGSIWLYNSSYLLRVLHLPKGSRG